MRRRVLPLLLAGALLLPGWAPALRSPGRARAVEGRAVAWAPLPPSVVRATIDTLLVDHLAKLLAFEADYASTGKRGGQYYQTLVSHSVVPADGAALAPDKLAAGPTDQTEKLTDFWADAKLSAQIPYAFWTDVYDGPEGRGYVLTVQVQLGAERWERSVNAGPERWRDQPWHALVVEK